MEKPNVFRFGGLFVVSAMYRSNTVALGFITVVCRAPETIIYLKSVLLH